VRFEEPASQRAPLAPTQLKINSNNSFLWLLNEEFTKFLHSQSPHQNNHSIIAMRISLQSFFLLLSSSSKVIRTDAFSISSGRNVHYSLISTKDTRTQNDQTFALNASSDDKHENDNQNEGELVTNEMFLRDMLADPEAASVDTIIVKGEKTISSDAKVRRKKKNGTHYRTLDNRDSLPFLVKVSTPDPYTSNEQMKKEAKLNTQLAKKKTGKNGKKKRWQQEEAESSRDGRERLHFFLYLY